MSRQISRGLSQDPGNGWIIRPGSPVLLSSMMGFLGAEEIFCRQTVEECSTSCCCCTGVGGGVVVVDGTGVVVVEFFSGELF